jgi:hypothetical protein
MCRLITRTLIIALLATALNRAQAAPVDLAQWFLTATAWDASVAAEAAGGMFKEIAAPDFLGGKMQFAGLSLQTLCADYQGPFLTPNWKLLKYDRKHHIGLAADHNDGHGCALFKAPTPALTVPDADLSQSGTGRGLRLGSTYAQVLTIYGPPVKHGRHFVALYSALVPDVSLHKRINDSEHITLVIDNDRVSSILIYIACCNP